MALACLRRPVSHLVARADPKPETEKREWRISKGQPGGERKRSNPSNPGRGGGGETRRVNAIVVVY